MGVKFTVNNRILRCGRWKAAGIVSACERYSNSAREAERVSATSSARSMLAVGRCRGMLEVPMRNITYLNFWLQNVRK
eukprot:2953529-Amphidinium_carterae.1